MTSAPRRERALDRRIAPTPALVLTVSAVLLAADWLYPQIGDNLLGGICDEIAHLLTGVLVVMILPPDRARSSVEPTPCSNPRAGFSSQRTRRFAAGLLAGSVLIDLDHVPRLLGTEWLTNGTPRPYTHSLLMLVALALLAAARPHPRWLLVGAFVGLAVHFGRDLAESGAGISLLWPWTKASESVPHWTYLAAVGGASLLAGIQAGRRRRAPGRARMRVWPWLEARKRRLAR